MFGDKELEGVDIYGIIQDFEYNYWLATDQGLIMHDGYTFTKVDCAEMNGNSVFNSKINSKGEIFCNNLNQ